MPKLRREAKGDVIDLTLTISDSADFEAYVSTAVYQLWGFIYG